MMKIYISWTSDMQKVNGDDGVEWVDAEEEEEVYIVLLLVENVDVACMTLMYFCFV